MAKMQFDIKVKNGTYINNNNETKSRYKTVGKVMMGDDGSQFALLDPTVNLAGFEREAGKDMLLASFFEPYQENQNGQQQGQQQAQGGFQQQGQQGGYQQSNQNSFQQQHPNNNQR